MSGSSMAEHLDVIQAIGPGEAGAALDELVNCRAFSLCRFWLHPSLEAVSR